MVAGIIVFAVGLKKTLAHVEDHLHAVEAFTLCGGLALYLVALSAFKRRNVGSWNARRLLAAALLLAFWPAAQRLPALAALAVVTLVACALILWEALGMSAARGGRQPSGIIGA